MVSQLAAAIAAVLAVVLAYRLIGPVGDFLLRATKRQSSLSLATFKELALGGQVSRRERVRLLAAVGIVGMALLFWLIDWVAGLVAAAVLPWLVLKAASWRHARYRLAVECSLPELAQSISTVLAGGSSLIYALQEIACTSEGPLGREMKMIDTQLRIGITVDEALNGFKSRIGSQRVELFVAALLVQRQVGGDLVKLMREVARAGEDQLYLEKEVKTASAQARFTAVLVIALPAFAVGISLLISPTLIEGILKSFIAVWLLGFSAIMQAVGFVMIKRIASAPLRRS